MLPDIFQFLIIPRFWSGISSFSGVSGIQTVKYAWPENVENYTELFDLNYFT